MQHNPIFSKKYLDTKIVNFGLDKVSEIDKKKEIIELWNKSLRSGRIIKTKEISIQADFLNGFFGDVLGYVYKHADKWNLEKEYSATGGKKADGALGYFTLENDIIKSDVRVVIELKDAKSDLDKPQNRKDDKRTPVEQAFSYASRAGGKCKWVIVSNFKEIRLYHSSDISKYELFSIFELAKDEELRRFFFLLQSERLFLETTKSSVDAIYKERQDKEAEISKDFYADYKKVRLELFAHLKENNRGIDELVIFSKTQKILDRAIFVCFCEDVGLIDPYTFRGILREAKKAIDFSETKLWKRVKDLFRAINEGYPDANINKFNGGLFAGDDVLDNLIIKDKVMEHLVQLEGYDFNSDLNVNILGHIFEQSISDIEEIKAEIRDKEFDKKKGKQKKDGIFYTPEYITRYIVKEAVGGWLDERKEELDFEKLPELEETDYKSIKYVKKLDKKQRKKVDALSYNKKVEKHIVFWEAYKEQLLNIKVLDPACGSGAFLNQVFDYLYSEGQKVNNELAGLKAGQRDVFDLEKHILNNNIFGIDLNKESVQITKLSLWLKTANKEKELTALDNNILCGNSLINDEGVAGEDAFDWNVGFKDIMEGGGFDVVIGNPPYVFTRGNEHLQLFNNFIWTNYKHNHGKINLYSVFLELSIDRLLKNNGRLGFITPETFIRTSTYAEIRRFLINSYNIESISVYGMGVFENVTAETITMIIKKNFTETNKVFFYKHKSIEIFDTFIEKQKAFNKTPENRFVYGSNKDDRKLFDKLKRNKVLLGDFIDVRNGIATKSGKNNFLSTVKVDEKYKKLLEAPDLFRYGFEWPGVYINYDKDVLHRPRKEETFLANKILIQRVSSRLICSYDNNQYYTFNSVNNLVLKEENSYNLKLLLGILNSKLIDLFYRRNYSLGANFTITVTKTNLDSIPIPEWKISDKMQQIVIELVDKVLFEIGEFVVLKNNFLNLLQSKFEIEKLTTKLQKWHNLEFKDFLKELKKAKVQLSLSEEAEWMQYFNEQKQKAQALKAEIDKTDKEIDQMVYQLYGLSEEEIKIVKES